LEYENAIHQYPDADAVMKRIRGVITAIARLAICDHASVGESPKWTLIVQIIADTRRNLHQLLKGKQLNSSLYGMYTEVLHDLTVVLKGSAAKVDTDNTTITAPPFIEEFREQRRRKRKPADAADERAKNPTTSTREVDDPQLLSKPEVPTRNIFAPPEVN
jgi:hypothetical protein